MTAGWGTTQRFRSVDDTEVKHRGDQGKKWRIKQTLNQLSSVLTLPQIIDARVPSHPLSPFLPFLLPLLPPSLSSHQSSLVIGGFFLRRFSFLSSCISSRHIATSPDHYVNYLLQIKLNWNKTISLYWDHWRLNHVLVSQVQTDMWRLLRSIFFIYVKSLHILGVTVWRASPPVNCRYETRACSVCDVLWN